MIAQVEPVELQNTLDFVEGAISNVLASWDTREHTVDPGLLLDALSELECARSTLTRLIEVADLLKKPIRDPEVIAAVARKLGVEPTEARTEASP